MPRWPWQRTPLEAPAETAPVAPEAAIGPDNATAEDAAAPVPEGPAPEPLPAYTEPPATPVIARRVATPPPTDPALAAELRRGVGPGAGDASQMLMLGEMGGFNQMAASLSESLATGERINRSSIYDQVARSAEAPMDAPEGDFAGSLPSLLSFSDPLSIIEGKPMDRPFGQRIARSEPEPAGPAVRDLVPFEPTKPREPLNPRRATGLGSVQRRELGQAAGADMGTEAPRLRRFSEAVTHESADVLPTPTVEPMVARSVPAGSEPPVPPASRGPAASNSTPASSASSTISRTVEPGAAAPFVSPADVPTRRGPVELTEPFRDRRALRSAPATATGANTPVQRAAVTPETAQSSSVPADMTLARAPQAEEAREVGESADTATYGSSATAAAPDAPVQRLPVSEPTTPAANSAVSLPAPASDPSTEQRAEGVVPYSEVLRDTSNTPEPAPADGEPSAQLESGVTLTDMPGAASAEVQPAANSADLSLQRLETGPVTPNTPTDPAELTTPADMPFAPTAPGAAEVRSGRVAASDGEFVTAGGAEAAVQRLVDNTASTPPASPTSTAETSAAPDAAPSPLTAASSSGQTPGTTTPADTREAAQTVDMERPVEAPPAIETHALADTSTQVISRLVDAEAVTPMARGPVQPSESAATSAETAYGPLELEMAEPQTSGASTAGDAGAAATEPSAASAAPVQRSPEAAPNALVSPPAQRSPDAGSFADASESPSERPLEDSPRANTAAGAPIAQRRADTSSAGPVSGTGPAVGALARSARGAEPDSGAPVAATNAGVMPAVPASQAPPAMPFAQRAPQDAPAQRSPSTVDAANSAQSAEPVAGTPPASGRSTTPNAADSRESGNSNPAAETATARPSALPFAQRTPAPNQTAGSPQPATSGPVQSPAERPEPQSAPPIAANAQGGTPATSMDSTTSAPAQSAASAPVMRTTAEVDTQGLPALDLPLAQSPASAAEPSSGTGTGSREADPAQSPALASTENATEPNQEPGVQTDGTATPSPSSTNVIARAIVPTTGESAPAYDALTLPYVAPGATSATPGEAGAAANLATDPPGGPDAGTSTPVMRSVSTGFDPGTEAARATPSPQSDSASEPNAGPTLSSDGGTNVISRAMSPANSDAEPAYDPIDLPFAAGPASAPTTVPGAGASAAPTTADTAASRGAVPSDSGSSVQRAAASMPTAAPAAADAAATGPMPAAGGAASMPLQRRAAGGEPGGSTSAPSLPAAAEHVSAETHATGEAPSAAVPASPPAGDGYTPLSLEMPSPAAVRDTTLATEAQEAPGSAISSSVESAPAEPEMVMRAIDTAGSPGHESAAGSDSVPGSPATRAPEIVAPTQMGSPAAPPPPMVYRSVDATDVRAVQALVGRSTGAADSAAPRAGRISRTTDPFALADPSTALTTQDAISAGLPLAEFSFGGETRNANREGANAGPTSMPASPAQPATSSFSPLVQRRPNPALGGDVVSSSSPFGDSATSHGSAWPHSGERTEALPFALPRVGPGSNSVQREFDAGHEPVEMPLVSPPPAIAREVDTARVENRISREVTIDEVHSQVDPGNGNANNNAPAPEPNIDEITEKVWQRIRRKLRIERERSRGIG